MPCVLVIYIAFWCYFNSPVDHELGGDRQYLDDQFPYPAEEGKRSPTSLIPVFKVFYLHAIQIYFAAPIVACGNCLNSFPLLLAWLVLACCALLELFLLYMLSCYLYMVGELSPEIITGSEDVGDEMVQLMETMGIWYGKRVRRAWKSTGYVVISSVSPTLGLLFSTSSQDWAYKPHVGENG